MSNYKEIGLPRRYLTDDEIVEVATKLVKGTPMPFRLRVWKGEGLIPVVLASPAVAESGLHLHPMEARVKLANYAMSALAGYPANGIMYFDYGDRADLHQVLFEYFGHKDRLRLFKPEARPKQWPALESLVGRVNL